MRAEQQFDFVIKARNESAAGFRSARTEAESFFRSAGRSFGATSDFGRAMRMLHGGGAVLGIKLAANELSRAGKAAQELAQWLAEGERSAGEIADRIARGLPFLGSVYSAGSDVGEGIISLLNVGGAKEQAKEAAAERERDIVQARRNKRNAEDKAVRDVEKRLRDKAALARREGAQKEFYQLDVWHDEERERINKMPASQANIKVAAQRRLDEAYRAERARILREMDADIEKWHKELAEKQAQADRDAQTAREKEARERIRVAEEEKRRALDVADYRAELDAERLKQAGNTMAAEQALVKAHYARLIEEAESAEEKDALKALRDAKVFGVEREHLLDEQRRKQRHRMHYGGVDFGPQLTTQYRDVLGRYTGERIDQENRRLEQERNNLLRELAMRAKRQEAVTDRIARGVERGGNNGHPLN